MRGGGSKFDVGAERGEEGVDTDPPEEADNATEEVAEPGDVTEEDTDE